VVSAVPDLLAPGLRVVFCGINPGRASAAAGAHYANPRNDFWRLLHAARFTPRLVAPAEQHLVLEWGLGLTNAAMRTTPGAGDLRRADFASSQSRLESIARDLAPAWIGFVGKAAYQGAFGERPALGVQARRLGDTQLFVLPSTSPANAAVPWPERRRWFEELAGRASGLPMRPAARAVVLDSSMRVLLVRFEFPEDRFWALPGGGIDPGETPESAIARELVEEVGVRAPVGPAIWTREHWFLGMERWAGQREIVYIVRLPERGGEIAPAMSAAQLAAEYVTDQRWWTQGELDAARDVVFSPRRLPALLRELVERGPPPSPIDAGV
jgi:TDG/mug DNA glycosylase family protein